MDNVLEDVVVADSIGEVVINYSELQEDVVGLDELFLSGNDARQILDEGIVRMASVETPTFLATGGGNEGGFGLGGAFGGLALGALLGRGNLFGNGGDYGYGYGGRGVVDNVSGLNNIQSAIDTSAILTNLADIKAAVPLAEAQVQLALAGSTGEIRSHLGAVENQLVSGQAVINKNISDAIAASLASQNNINLNVLQNGTANLMATKDSQYAVTVAIKEDGEKTRALITANQISELQRLAAERQDEIIELRNSAARDRDRNAIEINMINNQNQNQLQFQQQAQVLTSLHGGLVDALQSIRATNQAINIGAGTQVANPTNTNTNVRA